MSRLRVEGVLVRDARARTSADGEAMVELCINAGPYSPPILAMHSLGRGAAAQYICRSTAARLRRGQQVTVHANGYQLTGKPAELVLTRVDHIEQQGLPPSYTEPQRREPQPEVSTT